MRYLQFRTNFKNNAEVNVLNFVVKISKNEKVKQVSLMSVLRFGTEI